MNPKAHKELIRRQAAVQARVQPRSVRARHPENVVPMVDLADPKSTDRSLDVACGWGFVPLEFASLVRTAAGIDLTPEMVALARGVAAERGVANAEYYLGDAEDLTFGPATFEIVTCRFTFHHFPDSEKALFEMKRVLTPDGRIVVYDFVASADEKKAARHNEIESARDPAHVRAHSSKEFQALFRRCGLVEETRITTLWKREFSSWMAVINTDEDRARKVRKLMEATQPGNKAGLGVRIREGKLTFTHNCVAWRLHAKL